MFRKKNTTNQITIRNFRRYLLRYPLYFWVGTVGSVFGVIAQGIIPPLVVARTFRQLQVAYAAHEVLHLSQFMPAFWAFAGAMLTGALLWRLQSYCIWELETQAARDLVTDVYDHLQEQSARFHADRFGGAIVSQTNKYLGAFERLTDEFVWNIVPGITTLLVSLGVLLFVSPMYVLVLLAITIFYMFIMSKRMRRQMPFNVAAAESETQRTAALADAITNMGSIRAFASEDYESKRFARAAQHVHSKYHALSIEVLKTEAVSHFQTNSFSIVAFLFGLIAITQYNANVSVLYLILTYTQGLVGQLWQFGRIIRNINTSFGDATEMTNILGLEPEVKDPEQPEPVKIARGGIEFKNVSFYYSEDKKNPLFQRLDLKIKPGEKVGLVGPSGGGKTTITKLILRFMDIQDGQILIDGQDISKIAQTDLRSHISYVSQEPMLFHRSLAENIAYGDKNASPQTIKAIAKMAHADEFIEKLSSGYDTLVGERGVKLSGGQRQRIAIARAMLKNAPMLVLDEATSALDSDSERLIQDALWKLMEGRTAIVIAHRLSTIQKMDRIVVLSNGKIVEQGSHKELLHLKGVYSELWTHQSGGFMQD